VQELADRTSALDTAFIPALTPLLVVFRRKAWLADI
jgi:hypothetical protein